MGLPRLHLYLFLPKGTNLLLFIGKIAGPCLYCGTMHGGSISAHPSLNMTAPWGFQAVSPPCKVVVLHDLTQLHLDASHVSVLTEIAMENSPAEVALYLTLNFCSHGCY